MILPLLNIFLFFIYLYGLGYSLTRFLKGNSLENLLLRLGVGLGAFPVLGLLLNALNIPLDWKIFLAVSIIFPIVDCIKFVKSSQFRLKICHFAPIVNNKILLIIFLACVALYCGGSFSYPWLEDTDSWFHAAGIKYIAVEKNVNVSPLMFQYISPYPPGYDLLFGVMHQTSPSLYWTLKFFNGLIIALSYLFFYMLINSFLEDRNKSLLSTYFLFCIPCYLSHFIWAHSLIIALFFPALFLTFKATENRKFLFPAILVTAGIFLVQPTQAVKYVCLVILLFLAVLSDRTLRKEIILIVILASIVLSSILWWFPVIANMFAGGISLASPDNEVALGLSQIESSTIRERLASLFSASGGSATRSYNWKDYLFIPKLNNVNNPVGVGLVLSILAVIGLIRGLFNLKRLKGKQSVLSITMLLWLIFAFLGMNSQTFNLPVGLFAFRFWMLFAVPVCYFAAEALTFLISKIRSTPVKMTILTFILIAVFINSALPKIRTNSSRWSAGVGQFWTSRNEMEGYLWLRNNLKPNTRVFAYINSFFLNGFDMTNDFWTPHYQNTLAHLFDQDLGQTRLLLKENSYHYIIIGKRERNFFGKNKFGQKIRNLIEHRSFDLLFTNEDDVWIFKLN